ncbi:hypothetical protein TanjilG_00189 [Lupinus angustifolius]|uniref:Uncharacterized protein n=1 Tax=Lupinus angustifolius TaxID=3871 RepID=A0A394D1V1_LUPAN|nr:hypothetical protein TanjilG_00189 [Lupinus angustifolius]
MESSSSSALLGRNRGTVRVILARPYAFIAPTESMTYHHDSIVATEVRIWMGYGNNQLLLMSVFYDRDDYGYLSFSY